MSYESAKTWQERLDAAGKVFEKWDTSAERIIKRYRDERDTLNSRRRKFNILWSNVQVMTPALYGRPAKPEVSRRFKDSDPVGRVASEILERSLEFDVEHYPDFDNAMKGGVEDRLLPGRGTSWIRYEPHIEGDPQISNDVDASSERIGYECAPIDYVNWRDFRHSPARTWDEVWWVARCVWMTRGEGVKRFGEVFNSVPLEFEPKEKTGSSEELPHEAQEQKAKVWEIWNKHGREVVWIADSFNQQLDAVPDPLELDEFFPCPKPLYATTTTGSLVPVPDYTEYQDQAEELDTLTQRIHLLTRALKVVGVYNGEYKQLQRLLNEGVDNTMIGVDAWAAMAEKGGLKGAVEFLPIKEVAEVLQVLIETRQMVLTDIWQIMGLSDIMRGSSDANETLGAQEMKAQFGSMRLKVSQGDVARYASDIFRLKAQVMCGKFQPESLIAMSGAETFPEVQQNPQILQAAIQLLKNAQMKDFKIQVQSDSLAQIDEAAEKAERVEMLTALGGALEKGVQVATVAPQFIPAIGETILFVLRTYKAGKGVEAAWEQAIQQAGQAGPNPQQMQQQQEELQKAGQELQKKDEELKAQELDLFKRNTEHKVERIAFDAEKQVFDIQKKATEKQIGLEAEKAGLGLERDQDKAKQAANDAKREQQEVEKAKSSSAEVEDRNKRVTELAESVLASNAEVGKSLGEMSKAVMALAEAAGSDRELVVGANGRKRVVRVK